MSNTLPRFLLFVLFMLVTQTNHAKDGEIDPTFGMGSVVGYNAGMARNVARGLVVQSTGNIVVAIQNVDSSSSAFTLQRLHAYGQQDSSFGNNGSTMIRLPSNENSLRTLLHATDDSLYMVGQSSRTGALAIAVIKFDQNGRIQNAYGANGYADIGYQGKKTGVSAAVLMPDQSMLISGWFEDGGHFYPLLTRLNANGTLDTEFGTNGFAVFPDGLYSGGWFSRNFLKVDQTGRIIASTKRHDGSSWYQVFFRFNAQGQLDTSYGSQGAWDSQQSGDAIDVLLQDDGKLVLLAERYPEVVSISRSQPDGGLDPTFGVAGVFENYGIKSSFASGKIFRRANNDYFILTNDSGFNSDPYAFSLTPDGNLKTDVGTNGIITVEFTGFYSLLVDDAILQNDQTIYFIGGGSSPSSGASPALLTKISVGGLLDRSFASNGSYQMYGGDPVNFISALAWSAHGQLIAAGSAWVRDHFATSLTLIDSNTGYTAGGYLDVHGDEKYVKDVTVDTDGYVFVSGDFFNGWSSFNFGVTKMSYYLQPDLSFGFSGTMTAAVSGSGDIMNSFVLQDHRPILAGYSMNTRNGTYDAALVRLSENGWIDSTFLPQDSYHYIEIPNSFEFLNDLQRDVQGRLLIVGQSSRQNGRVALIRRLTPNGLLDPTFATSALSSLAHGFDEHVFDTVAPLPDSSLVIAGTARVGPKLFPFVVKLNRDGVPDLNFAQQGILTLDGFDGADSVKLLRLQDGKFILHAVRFENEANELLVIRINANGSIDDQFGEHGIYRHAVNDSGQGIVASNMMILPNQKIAMTFSANGNAYVFLIQNSTGTAEIDPDNDSDFVIDAHDPDDDNDGINDIAEVTFGFDPYRAGDGDKDPDNDGLSNIEEIQFGTDPHSRDTDKDFMLDGFELQHALNPLDASDATADKDGDGLNNLAEFNLGTNPSNSDTDGDTMPDQFEVLNEFDPINAADAVLDTDSDTLNNAEEFHHGTNPRSNDSDEDQMPDNFEIQYGLNPLSNADAMQDADSDGFTNLTEYQNGTNPNVSDRKDEHDSDGGDGSSGGGSTDWRMLAVLLLLSMLIRRTTTTWGRRYSRVLKNRW